MQESVTIGGVKYTLRDPGHLALMKGARQFIIQDRPNPLLDAVDAIGQLPESMPVGPRAKAEETIRVIAERAMLARNRVTAGDVGLFLQTRDGLVFAFWQFCPTVESFDQATGVVEQMLQEEGESTGTAKLQAKIDTASGMVESKNSYGPGQSSSGQ